MSRKERETELRRNIIIEAAEKLILTKGYDNTTMDEIAEESEFSKGSLYNYFKNKDEIYLAIATNAYELINDYTQKFIAEKKTGIEQLMAIGYGYYEFSKKYPKYANIFHDVGQKVPGIRDKPKDDLTPIEAKYLRKTEDYRKIFSKIMTMAVTKKLIRSDINPYVLGMLLGTIATNVVKEILEHKKEFKKLNIEIDNVINQLFDLVANGLRPREKQ